jgi:cytochrome c-type biogenesis protein CcmE
MAVEPEPIPAAPYTNAGGATPDEAGRGRPDGLDLTPRGAGTAAAPRRRTGRSGRRKLGVSAVLAVVLVGGAVILFQGLSNATVFFCNADEVDVKAGCMPGDRFRLQGSVVAGSISSADGVTEFEVLYGDTRIDVRHTGAPPELFQEGIPVVVEGAYDGTRYDSNRIMVKHSEEYKAENPDRVEPGAP